MIDGFVDNFVTTAFVLAILLIVSMVVLGVQRARHSRLRQNHTMLEEKLRDRETRLAEHAQTIGGLQRSVTERDQRLTSEFGRAERLEEAKTALDAALVDLRADRGALVERHQAAQEECADLKVQLEALRTATAKDRAAAEKEVATLRELREEMNSTVS